MDSFKIPLQSLEGSILSGSVVSAANGVALLNIEQICGIFKWKYFTFCMSGINFIPKSCSTADTYPIFYRGWNTLTQPSFLIGSGNLRR